MNRSSELFSAALRCLLTIGLGTTGLVGPAACTLPHQPGATTDAAAQGEESPTEDTPLGGCSPLFGTPIHDGGGSNTVAPAVEDPGVEVPIIPRELVLDPCDETASPESAWVQASSIHFDFYYLPDSAAQRDITEIIANREAAYEDIREALQIDAEPRLTFYLSPNRIEAAARGLGLGTAYPGSDLAEIVYTGVPTSYESQQYGHELAHLLAYYVAPDRPWRLPILDEGIAEMLDQSGRNLHHAYARNLIANEETRTRIGGFDWRDPSGDNYGRAGSLAQLIVEEFGMEGLLELWSATSQAKRGCHASYGCASSPDGLEAFLDAALNDTLGTSWEQVAGVWRERVLAAIAAGPFRPAAEDLASINALFATMDAAINDDDQNAYRTTMDGFYCNWADDEARGQIAQRAVSSYENVSSHVLAVHEIAMTNFDTVLALVARTEATGAVSVHTFYLEHFAVGWRVTWGTDWY